MLGSVEDVVSGCELMKACRFLMIAWKVRIYECGAFVAKFNAFFTVLINRSYALPNHGALAGINFHVMFGLKS